MTIAIISRQISHYHMARFRASAITLSDLVVIATANEGAFSELLAKDTGAFPTKRLFANQQEYERAIANGRIIDAVQGALSEIDARTVVIAGWAAAESFAAIRWARARAVPIVVMSDSQAFDAPRSRLREMLKARFVSMCDAAFVAGPTHRDYIVKLGMPIERVRLGYDVVDNAHFSSEADLARSEEKKIRSEYGLPARYVLASARFVCKKNIIGLIEAYNIALSRKKQSSPDLVILGGGEQADVILNKISQMGLDNKIHVLGYREYRDLPKLYGLADAFVHVPLVEQWGLVVNEAMASGIPSIVSCLSGAGLALIEHGKNGFLVSPHDKHDIAEMLSQVFALSPAERIAIGASARSTIARWGPDRFAEGLKASVAAANAAPRKGRLYFWDRILLEKMARKVIDTVA
ncbi:glycosyltransferase [Mesorhizobium sp. M1378]|uniref:glycosyltransferase n=1 Tax=Mesorhizobium sp. M1378 TaxID=2957092 RepID=UPI003339FEFC